MPGATGCTGVEIDDFNRDAGKRMADLAAACADLAKSGSAEVAAIDGNNGRALSAAVALEGTDAEGVFKCKCDALGELFCADENVLQAAEAFRRATPHVGLQKCWRGDEESDSVLLDQLTDHLGVERIGVIDDADAVGGRHPKRGHEAEGVEEGQDAEDLVSAVEHEDLRDLLDVGARCCSA